MYNFSYTEIWLLNRTRLISRLRVGEQYAKKEVNIIGTKSQISIYYGGKILEIYDRITDPHQSKAIKPHLKSAWGNTLKDNSYIRKRARALGEWVEELILTILARENSFVDFRRIWGILSLDKKYSHQIIDEACRLAHEQERWGYRAVLEFAERLEALKKQDPSGENRQLSIPAPKFTHDISQYSRIVQLKLVKGGSNES